MAPMKFYYDLRSQPCRSLYLFLKATNIEFETEIVDLFTGTHMQEEFGKVNPYRRVPVIDDDGFVLTESIAIMRYLANKHNLPQHWFPRGSDFKQQARLDEYLHWHHSNIRYVTMMLFRHQYINTLRRRPVKVDEVKQFRELFLKSINHLDKYFLADKDFIDGNDISVADLMAVCEITQLNAVHNEQLYLSNPKIAAWVKRVSARLQPHFDFAFKSVAEMGSMYDMAKESAKL